MCTLDTEAVAAVPLLPEITLALPAYNEAENIVPVVEAARQALDRWGRTWEILVVDNHSSDATPQLALGLAAADSRIRVVVHETNRLYSGSCRTALRDARGRYLAIMDSDGQFSADDLPQLVACLEAGNNLVFGWRRQRHDPLERLAISRVFNGLARWYLGFRLHDLNCGLRAMDRVMISATEIRHAINMANPEFFVRARQAKLSVAEVPIRHFPRVRGLSSHAVTKWWRIFFEVRRYFGALRAELRTIGQGATIARSAPPSSVDEAQGSTVCETR